MAKGFGGKSGGKGGRGMGTKHQTGFSAKVGKGKGMKSGRAEGPAKDCSY